MAKDVKMVFEHFKKMLNLACHEKCEMPFLACRAGGGPALAAALGRGPGAREPHGRLVCLAASHVHPSCIPRSPLLGQLEDALGHA